MRLVKSGPLNTSVPVYHTREPAKASNACADAKEVLNVIEFFKVRIYSFCLGLFGSE